MLLGFVSGEVLRCSYGKLADFKDPITNDDICPSSQQELQRVVNQAELGLGRGWGPNFSYLIELVEEALAAASRDQRAYRIGYMILRWAFPSLIPGARPHSPTVHIIFEGALSHVHRSCLCTDFFQDLDI
jgi:hypothetical protein